MKFKIFGENSNIYNYNVRPKMIEILKLRVPRHIRFIYSTLQGRCTGDLVIFISSCLRELQSF